MLNTISAILNNGVSAVGDYESIQTVTVGAGGQASISFTSIPSTYTHLQLRVFFKSNVSDWANFKINNDSTAANYRAHYLVGDGSTATSGNTTGSTSGILNTIGNSSQASVAIIDILDYANTNKNKTIRNLNGYDSNGTGQINLVSNLYISTNVVNQLALQLGSAGTFAQYSQFALYGVK